VHSKYSCDSKEDIDRICKFAISKGLTGIAITDHVAIWRYGDNFDESDLVSCKNDIIKLREKYKGKLKILFGMEISEHHYNPSFVDKAFNVGDYDVVLCSLQDDVYIPTQNLKLHYNENDFTKYSSEEILQIVKRYYEMLKEASKKYDYDILAHLTYPLRYICVRDKIDFNYNLIKEDIVEILKIIIDRNKALELNTSNSQDGFFMPNESILKLYKEMGGELITLGTDAHVAEKVDNGLKLGKELLKKCGFTKYYYYENRQPKIAETL
jgi:histidinol-phosphatase (PHP family)